MNSLPIRLIAFLVGLCAALPCVGAQGAKVPALCPTVVGLLATYFNNRTPNSELARVEVRRCTEAEGYGFQLVAWPSGRSVTPLVVDTSGGGVFQATARENLFYIEITGGIGARFPVYVIRYEHGNPKLVLEGISRGDEEVKMDRDGLDLVFQKFLRGDPPWRAAHYHFKPDFEAMEPPGGLEALPEPPPPKHPLVVPAAKPPGEAPIPLKMASLEYPRFPALARITGTVVLSVRVDKEGAVSEVHIISGPSVLAYSTLDNIKLWRFLPAPTDTAKSEREFELQYVFALTGEADSAHWSSEMTYEYPDRVTVTSKALLLQPPTTEAPEPVRP
jgi:TonB family protein